jgi:hypothetical protein
VAFTSQSTLAILNLRLNSWKQKSADADQVITDSYSMGDAFPSAAVSVGLRFFIKSQRLAQNVVLDLYELHKYRRVFQT